MINLDLASIETIMYAFFLALVRCSIFIYSLPIVGSKSLPNPLKIMLIVVLTIVGSLNIYPRLDEVLATQSMVSLVSSQLLIGLLMAFMYRLVFEILEMAGRIISMAVGFGFADQPGFASNQKNSMIGSLFYIFIALVFIASDGINLFVSTVLESFSLISIPWGDSLSSLYPDVVSWMQLIFVQGMMMALPVVGAVYGCTIMLSVLNKAAPSLQVISVGFPLYILCGMYFLYLTNVDRANDSLNLFEAIHSLIFNTLRGLRV